MAGNSTTRKRLTIGWRAGVGSCSKSLDELRLFKQHGRRLGLLALGVHGGQVLVRADGSDRTNRTNKTYRTNRRNEARFSDGWCFSIFLAFLSGFNSGPNVSTHKPGKHISSSSCLWLDGPDCWELQQNSEYAWLVGTVLLAINSRIREAQTLLSHVT
jgi:hypothetical protein